jgi:periplasmic protein TonB
MKYQMKAFQMSLAFHALIIILLIAMSNTLPHGDNLIVIDFTIEDAERSAVLINKPAETVHPSVHQQQKVKREEAEITQHAPEIVKSSFIPLPPAHQERQQMAIPDVRVPFSAQSENISESVKNDKKYDANQNALSKNNNAAAFLKDTAGKHKDTMTETGKNAENISRAGVPVYLKTNFSYIRDIINRHITYPRLAKKMGWEGKGKISFIITVNGDIKDIQVIESTGREILDRNAREAVRNASPFPRPPVDAKIIMPVLYRLY